MFAMKIPDFPVAADVPFGEVTPFVPPASSELLIVVTVKFLVGPNSEDIDRTIPFGTGRLFCRRGEGRVFILPYDFAKGDSSDSPLSEVRRSPFFEGVASSCKGSAGTVRILVPFGVRWGEF